MKHWYFTGWLWLGMIPLVVGQNKTEAPSTFKQICFYTIDKEGFEDFLEMEKAVRTQEYRAVFIAIRKMRQQLKNFKPEDYSRAFELWYLGNYTDFNTQVQVAKEATLASLKTYEERLHHNSAVYYDHRLFLEHYLAFTTEAFYPEYWFMSQERYFSEGVVERVRRQNPEEGYELFSNSTFYRPFDLFNSMAEREQKDIREYLDVPAAALDTTSFIPYSYMALNRSTAAYILEHFNLDDATQEITLDREIRALQRFLANVRSGKIYLIARFNHLEIRRMRTIEGRKKRENLPTTAND